MGQHLRAALGRAGRVELARLQLDEGLSERAAAAALSVAGPRGQDATRLWALVTAAGALLRGSGTVSSRAAVKSREVV